MPIDPNLYTFVKTQLAVGKSKEEISAMLITKGGWNQGDIDMIFSEVGSTTVVPPPPQFQQPPQPHVQSLVQPQSPLQPLTSLKPLTSLQSSVTPNAPTSPAPVPAFSGGPVVTAASNAPKKKKKLVAFIIVVVILIILGAVGIVTHYFGVSFF